MHEPVDHRRRPRPRHRRSRPSRRRVCCWSRSASPARSGWRRARTSGWRPERRRGCSRPRPRSARGSRAGGATPRPVAPAVARRRAGSPTRSPSRRRHAGRRGRPGSPARSRGCFYVCLAGARRAQEDDVVLRGEEVERAQVEDERSRTPRASCGLGSGPASSEPRRREPRGRRPRWRAAPRRSGSSTPLRAPAPQASAALWPPRAPSRPGSGRRGGVNGSGSTPTPLCPIPVAASAGFASPLIASGSGERMLHHRSRESAGGGSRTHMPSRAPEFKSGASDRFATPAQVSVASRRDPSQAC